MTQQLKFLLKHDRFPDEKGADTIEIVVDGEGADVASIDDLIEIVREEVDTARKRAVGTHIVDYDSFSSDSAYLDQVDIFAGQTVVVGVSLAGEPASYGVLGRYDDGEEYADLATGVTAADAEFQVRWKMAEEQGATPAEFDDFLDAMIEIEIVRCEPGPISDDELRRALQALIDETVAAGHSGEALDKAVRLLSEPAPETAVPAGPRP